jgi:hypothetical protein
MRPNPIDRSAEQAVDRIHREDVSSGDLATAPAEEGHRSQAAGDGGTPRAGLATIKEHVEPMRRSFPRPTPRRLGSVECMLLALIALGVAITAVMTIVNP